MDRKGPYFTWLVNDTSVYQVGFPTKEAQLAVENEEDYVRTLVVKAAITKGATPVGTMEVDPDGNQKVTWVSSIHKDMFETSQNPLPLEEEGATGSAGCEFESPVKKKACAPESVIEKLTPKSKRGFGRSLQCTEGQNLDSNDGTNTTDTKDRNYAGDCLAESMGTLSPFKGSNNDKEAPSRYDWDDNNNGCNDIDDFNDFHSLQWCEGSEAVVSNIPPPFVEEIFVNFLNVALQNEGFTTAVQSCGLYCLDTKSVIVKFSEEVARKVCTSLNNTKYLHSFLKFEFKENEAAGAESSSVKIFNIPSPFVEELFRCYIVGCLEEDGRTDVTPSSIVECGEYNPTDKSVVMKFTDPNLARTVSRLKMKFLHYELRAELASDDIGFCLLPRRKASGLVEGPVPQMQGTFPSDEGSRTIRVSNLSTSFFEEEEFKTCILSCLVNEGFVDRDQKVCDIIDRCCDVDLNLGHVSVVFKTRELAEFAVLLEDVQYENGKISLSFFNADDFANRESTSSPKSGSLVRTLEDPDGLAILMKQLLRTRHAFISGKSHDSALARLHLDLKLKHVATSVEELRIKRRSLRNKYNRCTKDGTGDSWEYYKVMAVILGKSPIDTLAGTAFDKDSDYEETFPNLVYNKDVFSYDRGTVWSKDASVKVIALCVKYEDEYKDKVRQSSFRKKISRELAEKSFGQYRYHPDQIEAFMKRNETLYRKEHIRQITSGAAGAVSHIAWPLFENMAPLIADLPNIEPEVTISAGTCSSVRRRTPPQDEKKSSNQKLASIERQTIAMETIANYVRTSEPLKALLMEKFKSTKP